MKAERIHPTPAFVPIAITIETEAEAKHLYHLLNLSNYGIACVYENLCMKCPVTEGEVMQMHHAIAGVYHP